MKQMLDDYGLKLDNVPMFCDNRRVTNLSKSPIQHCQTKYIDIRHQFFKEHIQKRDISLCK